MKFAFFAAALIGFTNAVSYEQMIDEEFNLAQVDDEFDYEDFDFAQLEDFDFDDDEFAEVDESDFEDYDFAEIGDEEYDDFNFAQIDSEGYADEDALKVKLNTPDCKDEKKVPFESAVMGALQELGSKSNDLASALKVQFEKNRQLKAGQVMNVSGQLVVRPKSEDLEVTVPKKEDDKKKDETPTVKVEGKKEEKK